MIVWGGRRLRNEHGGRYAPASDSLDGHRRRAALPAARNYPTAVWTGDEMIVWGGLNTSDVDLNTGGRYDPTTDSWTATSTAGAPLGRYDHTAVWTGSEMVVWGGMNGTSHQTLNTGGRYDPATNSLDRDLHRHERPVERDRSTRRSGSGSEMIVWGGYTQISPFSTDTGGRYDPVANTWDTTT